ncbi:hypothetical protein, partial [Escherichia coli]|uniref:hypothetical protein n=1 Tax=Escherichia coli TaxID=562 RepID=UPI001BDC519F
ILTFQNHTNRPLTDFGGKTSIFSHPVYLFLREFSLQDFRGGSSTALRLFLIFSAFSIWNLSRTACKAAWAFLTAPSRIPSSTSSCASAVRRLAGLAPFCGRVCEGSASNASHTSAEAAGLGFISTGLTRMRPLGGEVSSPLNKVLTVMLPTY